MNPGCRALGVNPAGDLSSSRADALHVHDLPGLAAVILLHRVAENLLMLKQGVVGWYAGRGASAPGED